MDDLLITSRVKVSMQRVNNPWRKHLNCKRVTSYQDFGDKRLNFKIFLETKQTSRHLQRLRFDENGLPSVKPLKPTQHIHPQEFRLLIDLRLGATKTNAPHKKAASWNLCLLLLHQQVMMTDRIYLLRDWLYTYLPIMLKYSYTRWEKTDTYLLPKNVFRVWTILQTKSYWAGFTGKFLCTGWSRKMWQLPFASKSRDVTCSA